MTQFEFRMRRPHLWLSLAMLGVMAFLVAPASAQNKYATSDSMSGYVHWIDLYDSSNRVIDPANENAQPYSPEKTCGRCHDYQSISHGWHFNAIEPEAEPGRPGQPWIWSDERTGTHLPLSYRGWLGTFDPDSIGLSRWQVAAKLGGFLPGGGPGSAESLATKEAVEGDQEEASEFSENRTNVTGPLPVDCMMCHHRQGSGYSPFAWTEQIEGENFAYGPTAAMGIGVVSGTSTRLKEDFDRQAEGAAEKLPKIAYETNRFRSDGKVFFDLIRKPANDSCYYCHTTTQADIAGGTRWLHDEDVHVRAGIACADCHRNGLSHETVRAFPGEKHSSPDAAAFSCQGCHLGGDDHSDSAPMPGRLGAPKPLHKGLPPLHFEKLSCTACHSGTLPDAEPPRLINSITHRLGEHVKRTGEELPGIVGPVMLPLAVNKSHSDAPSELDSADGTSADSSVSSLEWLQSPSGQLTPHRMMWPSYWGLKTSDGIVPINPEQAYDIVRRPLGVRRQFAEEMAEVKISLSTRKELLGDDRARVKPEEWTVDEQKIMEEAEASEREIQINERMAEALAKIEEDFSDQTAVYISGGKGFLRDGDDKIQLLAADEIGDAAKPYAWPMAHNVRPARQSLGIDGCVQCHSESAKFFATQLTPIGALPGQEVDTMPVLELQGLDADRMAQWNGLFQGRSVFKILGIVALGLTILVTLSACAINLSAFWRR